MTRISSVSTIALAAMMAFATPALAEGKHDRAQEAIAEARAKIDAADKVGASTSTPRMQADAQAQLRAAEEHLASGDKAKAIDEAHRASQLADTALGQAQRAHADAAHNATANARDAAQNAQVDAAAANARADAAAQAAAAAQADAAAARSAPPVVVQAPPAPAPTTTITTETTKSATPAVVHRAAVKRKVVRRAVVRHPAAVTEKTKTTVTTGQ
uniref:hypothetical protein n=1 Tax=uncultured Sphingomonas sp. TaxID=158754 RepID=UPI0035C9A7C4